VIGRHHFVLDVDVRINLVRQADEAYACDIQYRIRQLKALISGAISTVNTCETAVHAAVVSPSIVVVVAVVDGASILKLRTDEPLWQWWNLDGHCC
jgi:adenosine/AMP kinase